MAPIIRPTRKVSFASHAKGPIPVDMLDAQIQNLIDAIHSTQEALGEIRRDDGQLKVQVQAHQVRAEIAEIEQKIVDTGRLVADTAANFTESAREVDLRAKDAEIAAFSVSAQFSVLNQAGIEARDALSDAENAADSAANSAITAANSANYALAQADNAIAANIEASQWAEYLAGPVVNSVEAPAYIAGHPFGHGLYYQPVEGYGGVAGLWSAKWWAVYAAQLVGPWSFYYLGSWATPPVPGSTNPATGIKVPNPLSPGSFYYNTTSHQLFIWDGTQWLQPFVQVLTPGYTSSFTYVAAAGQTVFSGTDIHGNVPVVGLSPSDVHQNGLRLVYGNQYTVNTTTNAMTLVTPATASDVVQWDLLSGVTPDVALSVTVRKVTITPVPDGANTVFYMTYIDSGSGVSPVGVTGGPQLQVSLDGIVQEPGVDFVASGPNLTMGVPPPANSRFWALWYQAGTDEPTPPSAPVAGSVTITGSTIATNLLTANPGTWTGTPAPVLTYLWRRDGVSLGVTTPTYTTVTPGDVGHLITVTVTGTNSVSSASATSPNFGPITDVPAAPTNSVPPVIAGSTVVGAVLTVTSPGTWSGYPAPTFTYQWKSGAANVGTGSTYTTVTGDLGLNITCVVTATNAYGNASATSNSIGPIASGGRLDFSSPGGSGLFITLEDI